MIVPAVGTIVPGRGTTNGGEPLKRLLYVAMLGMLLLLAGCLCPPCPTCEPTVVCPTVAPTATVQPTATPVPWSINWDARLDALNVSIDWNESQGKRYWPIAIWITVDGQWDQVPQWARAYLVDFPEAGGDHHVFGRCLDAGSGVLGDKSFMLSWPDGADSRTPEASGWANIPIFGGAYYPDQGQTGPYSWEALNGLPVRGIGLPYNRHVSIFVVWKGRW